MEPLPPHSNPGHWRARLAAGRDWLRPDAPTLLWLLALVASLPLLGLSLHDALYRHKAPLGPAEVRSAAGTALLAAVGGAVQIQLHDAAALLRGLASVAGPRCAGLFDGSAWPGGIALFNPDGALLCGSETRAMQPHAAAGQEFLRAALIDGGATPVLAALPTGWITGGPATVMALALPRRGGAPEAADMTGVLALGLTMDWMQPAPASGVDVPSLLLLEPRDLVVLAAPRSQAALLGHQVLWPAVLDQVRRGVVAGSLQLHGSAPAAATVMWRRLGGEATPPVLLAAFWPLPPPATEPVPGVFALMWRAELMLALGLAAAWLLVGRGLAGRLRALSRGQRLSGGAPPMLAAVAARLAERAGREAAWAAQLAAGQAELRLLSDGASELFELLGPGRDRRAVYGASMALLGYGPAELMGRSLAQDRPAEDWHRLDTALRELADGPGGVAICHNRARRRDGGLIWLETRMSRMDNGAVCLVSHDISARRQSEQALAEADRRLATLALEDALTGLANRRRFDAALTQELQRAARDRASLGVVLVEISGFAAYRERIGSARADATLRRVARTVAGALLRPGDLAARLDADRLALLLPGADAIGAGLVERRVFGAIAALQIADLQAETGVLRVCTGVAVVEEETVAPVAAELLATAEASLRRARAGEA